MRRVFAAATAAICAVAALPSFAGVAFETKNDTDTAKIYTFGSPVESGEITQSNIGSASGANNNRFAFRAGIVNVKAGGYVRVSGYDSPSQWKNEACGNWCGCNGDAATLNVMGGTFWLDKGSYNTTTYPGVGRLRIGVNDAASGRTGVARVNVSAGLFRVDNVLMCGASVYNDDTSKNSPAEMNMSGGTAIIENFWLGARTGSVSSTAEFNLTGGELQVNSFVFQPYHNQTFNWGSGTIVAGKADVFTSANLAAGATRTVNVTGTPAVFDTGNFAQTIPADIASGTGTLKLTGGNTVTLSAAPTFGLWLDGTTLVPAGGALLVSSSGTFTFGGSATVSGSLTLGSGASIVCHVDSPPAGYSATLTVTEGVTVTDVGSVLDFVTITGNGAAGCEKTISSDGKTITVSKAGSPYYTWNGSGTNWGDVGAWQNAGAAATWDDGNNAIFSTSNDTATVAANVVANSVLFNADATIDGSSTLTVPSVSVVPGVAAVITAPTAGPLEITGGGTLTLGASRSAATTLSEGTLAMSGSGTTLDWSNFTLGTDPATPVIVRFEDGAALASASAEYNFGNVANITSTVCKADGDWTFSGIVRFGRASGANTTFVNESGVLTLGNYVGVGTQLSADAAASSELVIAGGTVSVSNTAPGAPYITVGSFGSGIVTVTNNATFNVALSMGLSIHSGSGTLNVSDGGTATFGTEIILGWSNNDAGTGTVNLGTGGMVVANTVRGATHGTGVFNFDGGTLKAGAAGNLIQASNRLTVNVGANGGTIDNDGKNITISKSLSGSGTINLIGSGATAFAAGVGSACGVSVASGTTLKFNGGSSLASLALAADSTNDVTAVLPIALSGSLTLPTSGTAALTFNGGAFPIGVYRLFTYSGAAAADGAKFAPETNGETATWSVINGALTLTVGNPPNTWIGGSTGSLSDQSNWSRGVVPGRGETAALGAGLAATFTVGASFNPDVIIIPEWSADVTFSGENAIIGLAAVTNFSGSVCMFEVPVTFANEINVYQTAYYYCDSSGEQHSVDGGHVHFVGGVTGTSFAEGTSRRLNGAYTISATAGWVANNYAENLWTLPGGTSANGSSLTITGSSYATPGTTDTSMLLMGSGSAFTTGVVRTSNRVSYRIYGEYVVTEELEVVLNSDTYIAQRYDGNYKFEKLTLVEKSNGRCFFVGNSTRYNGTKSVYIGAGGINVNGLGDKSTAIVLGYDNKTSHDVTHLYPWHSDYTICGKGGTTRDILINRAAYLHTDDENGVARTVTLDGIADVRDTLIVNGHGKLQVNSDGMNGEANRIGNIIVTDAATLAYAPGADLGAGAVSVGASATLKVAGSGTVTVAGGITLADGATLAFNFTNRTTPTLAVASGKTMTANGAVTVKVDGVRPRGGTHILTTCGGFDAEGVAVSLAADAPKWVKSFSVNAEGNLVLDVKPRGMVIIVK